MSGSAHTSAARLPESVRPVRYGVHLWLDPAKADFAGELRLEAQATAVVEEVRLHARGLSIQEAALEQGGRAEPCAINLLEAEEQVALRLAAPLEPGPFTLHLHYTGKVGQGMSGLYLSKDGDDLCLATQCEATDARAFVPCLDEPAFKASWAWTVTAPKGATVLTNGALASRTESGGEATWAFAATPPMASYLAAVVVGAFAGTDAMAANGVPFRVWALGGREKLGVHARDFAAKLLPWFEEAYGQPYAFGKYDQVAVPSFAFGAMENAGLVTFRPSLLLVDPAVASWDDRRDVALVVAHEFAHMWFGDLVTMAWWDDLWLNEAFAEWMAHRAVDALAPDLEVWARFRARAAGALSTDALEGTHAIYTPVATPSEAAELFDAITYGKGSAVLRMLHAYLGEAAFRDGLRSYMAAFRFGNAKGSDLWRHLGEASGQDVSGVMRDWIEQPGHPVTSASWDGRRLTLRQERAASSPLARPPATRWRVPLVVRYEDDKGVHERPILLAAPEEAVDLPVQGRLKWLWPNAGDVGFFRCRVEGGLQLAALGAVPRLAPAERVAVLRDLWMELRAGDCPPQRFLDAFAALLDGEASYEPLQHQVAVARELERVLEMRAPEALPAYRAWLVGRLAPSLAKLGFSPAASEPPQDRLRRAALLRAVAAIARDPSAAAAARQVAAAERLDPAKVDANLSGAAVGVEAVLGDDATLGLHLATFQARRAAKASPQDTERYLYALPAFRQPQQTRHILALCLDGTIAPQAAGPILKFLLTEPHAQRQAWIFVKEHWDFVTTKLGESWVANIVEAVGDLPADLAPEVHAFFDANLKGMAGQAYGRCKEKLTIRAEFLDRFAPELATWAKRSL